MPVAVEPILGSELPKDSYPKLNNNDQLLANLANSNEQKINQIETGDSNAMIGVYKVQDVTNTDDYVVAYLGLTLFDGLRLNVEVYNQNTGAVTVDLNVLGAKSVVNVIDNVESALVAGDFVGIAELQFDLARDKFQIIGVKPAGTVTAADVSVVDAGYTAITGANQQLLDDDIDAAIQQNIDDMAIIEDNLDILRTGPTVSGTADAIVLTSATAATFDFTKDMNFTTFEAPGTNTGPMTVNYDVHGVVAIQKPDGAGGYTAMEAGDVPIGSPITIYRKVSGNFFLHAPKVGGASVSNVQRDSIVMTGTIINVPITAVDLSKAIATVKVWNTGSGPDASEMFVGAELTSATNLRLHLEVYDASNQPEVAWQVVEYENVKSLQRDVLLVDSAIETDAIASVDITKSILFFSYTTIIGSSVNLAGLYGELTDATTLTFKQFGTAGWAKDAYWQVIEFN